MRRAGLVLALLLAVRAGAQTEEPQGAPPSEPPRSTPAPSPRSPPTTAHLTFKDNVRLRFTGYLDVGAFITSGDGVAYVRDVGARVPGSPAAWVFHGDPWANTVNSQGDPADLGLDRTTIPRFDTVRSRGYPSFIVNMANVGMVGSVGRSLLFETSLNFEPRTGRLGSPGDLFEVALAYAEWMPFSSLDLHLYLGKFESVVGIEYRTRAAPDRPGITPSLGARYSTGLPTGLKLRGSFFGGVLGYAAAVTNGGMFTEKFAHFFDDVDTNAGKTVSGRLSLRPFRSYVELGSSAAYGAQDGQANNRVIQQQVGLDLKLILGDLTMRGEAMRVMAAGGGATLAPSLRADVWYAEAFLQIVPLLGILARADFRRARLYADPNLYFTHLLRLTGGVRLDITYNAILKLEYLHLRELSGPFIEDDVLTSSLVLRF